MPTYEYKCTNCNLILNVSHGINVEHQQYCLTCLTPMVKDFVCQLRVTQVMEV